MPGVQNTALSGLFAYTADNGSFAEGGDSGGPVVLAYSNNWYLAAIQVTSTNFGTWIGNITFPPSLTVPSIRAHICTVVDPCN